MVSSLVAQLATNSSLNLGVRKPGQSYLFTGRDAYKHDLDSIHPLAVNALLQLASLNPVLRSYKNVLFSDAVKGLDRTMLSGEANVELDRNIAAFLPLLGPYLMDGPSGKVIEWLVRRFRCGHNAPCTFVHITDAPMHQNQRVQRPRRPCTVLAVPRISPFCENAHYSPHKVHLPCTLTLPSHLITLPQTTIRLELSHPLQVRCSDRPTRLPRH
jgi:hypothetical protein